MGTHNEARVELYQQLTEMNQNQGKQIAKLIAHIKVLTKLLTLNSTKAPLQEE